MFTMNLVRMVTEFNWIILVTINQNHLLEIQKKKYLQDELEKVLQFSKSLHQMYALLLKRKIKMRFNNNQKLTGISFEYNKFSIKGSALGSQFKASSIEKNIENNNNSTISKKMNEDLNESLLVQIEYVWCVVSLSGFVSQMDEIINCR